MIHDSWIGACVFSKKKRYGYAWHALTNTLMDRERIPHDDGLLTRHYCRKKRNEPSKIKY